MSRVNKQKNKQKRRAASNRQAVVQDNEIKTTIEVTVAEALLVLLEMANCQGEDYDPSLERVITLLMESMESMGMIDDMA